MIEYINKEYVHGKLDKVEVIMMRKNGYINATKICDKYGKRLDNWTRNNKSKRLIIELKKFIIREESPRII